MPIEVGVWKMGGTPKRVRFSSIETEKRFENVLAQDLSLLDPDLLLIGRQVPTAFGKFIDMLTIDREGNLTVIELKRSKTPREVVAQVLDYGSWVRGLEDDDIANIFEAFQQKYDLERKTSLDKAFCEKFGVDEMPDTLNEAHELMVVAAELDDSTERIINYLTDFGVSVNAVFFRFFKDGENEFLTRAWLIEPEQVEAKVVEKREKLSWNGEFYVCFGANAKNRDWEEARRYGFISAGGGRWYTKSLEKLHEGARIWVYIPGTGYVGVGRILEKSVPVSEFLIDDDHGKSVPITNSPLAIAKSSADDPEEMEHLVKVGWIKTVPVAEAVLEKGFFSNQNSAAKPRAKNWQHTVDRLHVRFGVTD